MADKTGIDDPISDQSTASTSGISRGSHSQKKKPEAIQAEKQAKSAKDSNVSDKLDILITSVSNLKEDYKEFNSRLALLETQVEKKGPESSDDVITQADEYSHENFENEIEDSEEDANQFDSESFNDSFDAGVIADNVGPAIDEGIASRINEGLLLPSDRSRIKAIMQTHQRPENIEWLRTPKLNTALQISDVGAKRRDRHVALLQEQVGCTLKFVSNLMSEVKQGKMDRRNMYEQLSDTTRLLLASHKDISQHRRESLRPALNKDYRVICTAQQNARLTSNEFLFGEDLSKRADEALKAKRLANKIAGSNVAKNGNSRGRGYQNQTYMQYQGKSSGFPQYQNQWQYAYQNRYFTLLTFFFRLYR